MSKKELGRVEVFGRVKAGELSLKEAAERLSYRQVKRQWRRCGSRRLHRGASLLRIILGAEASRPLPPPTNCLSQC